MRKIMGKYGFLVRKHEFFLKKPILMQGLEKLRRAIRQSQQLL